MTDDKYNITVQNEFSGEDPSVASSIPWRRLALSAAVAAGMYAAWEDGHQKGRQEVYEQVQQEIQQCSD